MPAAEAADVSQPALGGDLVDCDREPIHVPGTVQPHGVLLALEPDTRVVRLASLNCAALLGVDAQRLVGRPVTDVLPGLRPDDLQPVAGSRTRFANPLRFAAAAGDRTFDGIAHLNDGLIVLELENPRPSSAIDAADAGSVDPFFQLVHRPLQRVAGCATVADVCQLVTDEVRAFTAFDRVMVYKFGDEGHGEVVAESVGPGDAEPYLGLRYPASDIPQQARELYKRQWLRLVADARYEPVGLWPDARHPLTGRPFEMGQCVLRSLSPVHRRYLAHMNVRATLTISLMAGERLWGLIVCHHSTPRFVPYATRAACELLGAVMSAQLVTKEGAVADAEAARRRENLARVLESVAGGGDDLGRRLADIGPGVRALFGADGLAVVEPDAVTSEGAAPPDDVSRAVAERAPLDASRTACATARLAPAWLDAGLAGQLGDDVAGALVVRVSPQLALVLYRRPVTHHVDWGGDPHKAVVARPDGTRGLDPRSSFALWREEVRGEALPWTALDLALAGDLCRLVSSLLVRHVGELRRLARALEAKHAEMEQFTYSVSHDLKNPLVTCRGFVGLLREDLAAGDRAACERDLQRIVRATETMGELLDGLLELSRVGRNLRVEAALPLEPTLRVAIEGARLDPLAAGCAVELVAPLPATVRADRLGLERALGNLLSNAAKYGAAGKRIEAGARAAAGGGVDVFVRDFGPGIDPKYHARIFRLFERLDTSRQGTGVGLASVAKVMELHEGRAWVESAAGAGCTFWLHFPETPTDNVPNTP